MSCQARLLLNTLLDQVASNGSLGEILSAVAPRHWIYLEIAGKLSESDHTRNNKIYKKWVQFYSSDGSRGQLNELFYCVMTFLMERQNEMCCILL
jgi:thiaminase